MSSYDESMEDFVQLDDESASDFEAAPPPKKVRLSSSVLLHFAILADISTVPACLPLAIERAFSRPRNLQ